MMADIELFARRMRNSLSRTAWAIRNFGLSTSLADRKPPGIMMIQIDGLSAVEFRRAMENGRLPFIASLIEKQKYAKHTVYSGLPSSTPAAQGELLYGVEYAVPAFCYYDKECQRIFSMFEGEDAREIQERLEKKGTPLLEGGSAYADIYTGGASEAHFCMTQLGWPDVIRTAPPLKQAVLALLHLPSLVRIGMLALLELVLALFDCCRGLIKAQDFWKEIKFVPSRVAVCIVMREALVIRSAMDLMRGLPVVHLNFLGYDEQAHRRGPDSSFAHWTLKGIDYAIKRIYHAARRSQTRDYDVWIYSDHGQKRTIPYVEHTGESVKAAISRVFDDVVDWSHFPRSGIQFQRARMLKVKRHRPETQPPERWPIITALGPLGCVYMKTKLSEEDQEKMGQALVEQARIPCVFSACGADRAMVWTENGRHVLPEQAGEVLGRDHPFLKETAKDMVALSHHPEAGDFFICGFRRNGEAISFPNENGSHGGISAEETSAFAILPEDAPLPATGNRPLRHKDLHTAAREFLKGPSAPAAFVPKPPEQLQRFIRVLTYNVHNCAGNDGYISPHRIARVIKRERPDIVALQELDVGRQRTLGEDQAGLIARYLRMDHHFHAAIAVKRERYGDAILSRFPMKIMHAGILPYRKGWIVDEPRGALWVSIELGGGIRIQVVNTHLGIWRKERILQAGALLGSDYLGHPQCEGGIILCGDFNSSPGSVVCRLIKTRLNDSQELLSHHKRIGTYSSRAPLHQIDHIFLNNYFEVGAVRVPKTHLARMASDHLPLVADLRYKGFTSGN